MSNGNNSNGSLKIPLGLMGVLLTICISFTGFWGLWSVARADVDNLKAEVGQLKPLKEAVAVLNEQMPRMDRDIQEIKTSQYEMQKDIKTLLQRNR